MNRLDRGYGPIAYFITFRCYGTWLHGDARGSADRRAGRNVYRTPRVEPHLGWERADLASLNHSPVRLGAARRAVVDEAIRSVCRHRSYFLHAINVRTNHVHTVVSAPGKPEPILSAFKAYATAALREAGLLPRNIRPWTRHGSTRYLWTPGALEMAIDYVLDGQGDDLPMSPPKSHRRP
jgi:REP element-mobilizing transposase RayT